MSELRTRLYALSIRIPRRHCQSAKNMVSTATVGKDPDLQLPAGPCYRSPINLTMYNLPGILDGNIHDLISQLQMAENAERLKASAIVWNCIAWIQHNYFTRSAEQSFLCIGLDTEMNKLPGHLKDVELPLFEFTGRLLTQPMIWPSPLNPMWHFMNVWDPQAGSNWSLPLTYRTITPGSWSLQMQARDIGTRQKICRTFFHTSMWCHYVAPIWDGFCTSFPGVCRQMGHSAGPDVKPGSRWFSVSGHRKSWKTFRNVLRKSLHWGNAVIWCMWLELRGFHAGKSPWNCTGSLSADPGVGAREVILQRLPNTDQRAMRLIVNSSRPSFMPTVQSGLLREQGRRPGIQGHMKEILKNKGWQSVRVMQISRDRHFRIPGYCHCFFSKVFPDCQLFCTFPLYWKVRQMTEDFLILSGNMDCLTGRVWSLIRWRGQVIALGEHNNNAGPDFLNARIRIGTTTGRNVEIHLRSSDWTDTNTTWIRLMIMYSPCGTQS